MSLALGQNETYINKVETGHRSVSMDAFFRICDYLNVSPATFFDENIRNTKIDINSLTETFRKLSTEQADYVYFLLKDLTK